MTADSCSFSILNQPVIPYGILTVASWPAYRFLRRQVRWSGIPIFLRVFHSLSWSTQRLWRSQWNKYVFFWNSHAFPIIQRMWPVWSLVPLTSKPNLNIWRFSIQVLEKPSLRILSMSLPSWEMNATVQWFEHSLVLLFLATGNGGWPFPDLWPLLVFQICWHIERNTLIEDLVKSFRILNSSAGIPSSPLPLLAAMLPKAPLTSHSRMSGFGWVTTPSWLSRPLRCFVLFWIVLHIPSISSWSLLVLLGLYHVCPLFCQSLDEMFLDISDFLGRDL